MFVDKNLIVQIDSCKDGHLSKHFNRELARKIEGGFDYPINLFPPYATKLF